MREQNKAPEKELNKIEASNLQDAEFKMLFIKTLNELRGRIDEFRENFNKEIEIKNGDGKHKREPIRNKE